jgi:hypothetical protein
MEKSTPKGATIAEESEPGHKPPSLGVQGRQWANSAPQGAPAETKRVNVGQTRPQKRGR